MSQYIKNLLSCLVIVGAWLSSGKLSAQVPTPPGQMVDVGGYNLHFQVMGTGGKTLIIEPGTGAWSLQWREFQKVLSKDFRVVTYDRAGYGWSEASPYSRTADHLVKELKLGLSGLGIEGPYILLGHSYGGLIMRAFAKQFPEATEALILADAASEGQFDKLPIEVSMPLQAGKLQFQELGLKARKGELPFAYMPIDSTLEATYWEAYQRSISRASYYEAMYNEMDLLLLTEKQATVEEPIRAPVLVISAGNSFGSFAHVPNLPVAESNQIWSNLQKELLELSTNSEQDILEAATHDLLLTGFDELKATVVAFVNGL